MYYIYNLSDPRDSSVHYVGRSINPEQRYRQHLTPASNTSEEKKNWLIELRRLGLKPTLNIIDCTEDRAEALTKELMWMQTYTDRGEELFNSVSVMQRKYKAWCEAG